MARIQTRAIGLWSLPSPWTLIASFPLLCTLQRRYCLFYWQGHGGPQRGQPMPREIWQTREAKDTELQSLSSSSSPGCLVGLLTGLWPTLVGRRLEGPQNLPPLTGGREHWGRSLVPHTAAAAESGCGWQDRDGEATPSCLSFRPQRGAVQLSWSSFGRPSPGEGA